MSTLEAPQLLASGGLKGELDISQRDPLWLKERGDKFYLRRDWRAAEHAYGLVLAQFSSSIMAHSDAMPDSHMHLGGDPGAIDELLLREGEELLTGDEVGTLKSTGGGEGPA